MKAPALWLLPPLDVRASAATRGTHQSVTVAEEVDRLSAGTPCFISQVLCLN